MNKKYWNTKEMSSLLVSQWRRVKQPRQGITSDWREQEGSPKILVYIKYKDIVFLFLRQSLMIFIIKGFLTIVFIFIVISTMFWPICSPAFFRCLSNSGTYTELQTTSFTESMGITCSDSINHNQVQVLRISVLLLACCQDWTSRWLSPKRLREPTPIIIMLCVLLNSLEWIFETYKLKAHTWLGLRLSCMIFYLRSYSDFIQQISRRNSPHSWEEYLW